MKLQELKEMKPSSKINHKRYGACELSEVTFSRDSFFGAIVKIKTEEGRALLAADCGSNIDTLMEDSLRQLEK